MGGSSLAKVGTLRIEYFDNPIGIDAPQPRLSWQLTSLSRDVRQNAYHIQVAPDEGDLLEERSLSWNSGWIAGDSSIQIPYAGPPLLSRTQHYWRVRIRTVCGEETEWSAVCRWEMGLLTAEDWTAEWIAPAVALCKPAGPAPMLRRDFQLNGKVDRARLYVTCHGLYRVWLNGASVSDEVLAPGWTSYTHRLQYQTYDVASLLRDSDNAIGAYLGEGWFAGNIGMDGAREHYGDRLALFLQLEVTYKDGRTERIITDRQWQSSTGPITFSGIYDGECYDARLERFGWSEPHHDEHDWQRVYVIDRPKGNLIAPQGPAMRRIEELVPLSFAITPTGDVVVDMGQNMVGWVRLKVQGLAGTTVTLRHAEALDSTGHIYTQNLRAAKQEVRYILKGGGEETYEPHFTFQGFRYVFVSGFPGVFTVGSITGVVVHSDVVQTGEFACSDSRVDQLQHNIIWSQKGNLLDVPTDCPQRDERLGWTGDAQVFLPTAAFNMNVAGFFTKWLADLAADQYPDGDVPFVVPDVLSASIQVAMNRRAAGEPGWGDAATVIPWNLYLAYADRHLLERQYRSMAGWVNFQRTHACEDYIWRGEFIFGDWLDFFTTGESVASGITSFSGRTSKCMIATAYFARSTDILHRAATVLGKMDEAKDFEQLLTRIKGAFNDEFVALDGTVGEGMQTAYVLALDFDLIPVERRSLAAEKLANDVRERGHLTTGFLGTPRLLDVLTRFGYLDLAYFLLTREAYPSWLYPIAQGATTIWERWDGIKTDGALQDPSLNSFNHYAHGAVGEWMYRVMGGINIDASAPAYKHILIRPRPGGSFTFVNASHESLYGYIGSRWRLEDGQFELRIEIPANTSAAVWLPDAILGEVTESARPLSECEGASTMRQDGSVVVLELGSGRYHFRFPLRRAHRAGVVRPK